MLLASAFVCGFSGDLRAQDPSADTPPRVPIPAEQADSANDVVLKPPINSTLEIRVARRPWLLEKLTNPKPDPSIKMNPPRPPVDLPDPPSMSRIVPKKATQGWIRRDGGQTPSYADPLKQTDSTQGQKGRNGRLESVPADNIRNGLRQQESDAAPMDSNDSQGSKDPPALENRSKTDSSLIGPQPPIEGVESSRATEFDPFAEAEPTKQRGLRVEPGPATSDSAADVPEDATLSTKSEPTKSESTEGELTDASDESSSSADEVPVRDLRIQNDGAPIDREQRDQRPANRADKAGASKQPSAAGVSQYVGSDSDEPTIPLDYAGYPSTKIRLTNTVYRMQNSMRQCLRYYYARPEVANERSNWGMLHSIMVYGVDTKIMAGSRPYSAIGWIAGNNACRGQKLLTQQSGRIAVKSGVGLQGHQAQMLAVFSLCNVPVEYPLYADDQRYSVQDVVEAEQLACKSGEELTFTLIGLAHYMATDSRWQNANGETWDFERLIREELSQPIVGAACGGTHRLMAFAHALRKRRAEGRPITGQWKRAERFTSDFVSYAYQIQNRDGSMSTDWFEGREDNGDLDRKIQTTGHIVEWLLTVTPDSQLQNPRLVSAVRYLLASMYNERGHDWKIGPKGHALRSLAMYYERVYQSGPAWESPSMARVKTTSPR